ncbi:MAG: UDP-glucose/GDP-mannose dehydrogenase family protein [Parcubacteria group bacterium]|nr:UDP-glucose/GDP-mannose dehydrogenase family protein [Parcubacteria group bacterium]
MAKDLKIGIIGVGILGSAVKSYFEDGGYEVFCYDKFNGIGSIEEVNKADIIFICVPTPRKADNSCDISIVNEVIGYITGRSKIVVIKSTVPPFTSNNLQAKYFQHRLLFNPEFLTEKRAHDDFRSPKIQLVGYTEQSKPFASFVLGILPAAGFSKIMPAAAAEMFKYVRNCQLATKNAFFNQIYDLCQRTGIDYSLIKEVAENDPWIGREHLDPVMDSYRGFNGKCLPKDTEAFLKWAEGNGIDLSVLRQAVEFNSMLLASQKIKKDS